MSPLLVALTVLAWTAAAAIVLIALILGGYLAAATDLARARLQSEKRLHGAHYQ